MKTIAELKNYTGTCRALAASQKRARPPALQVPTPLCSPAR